MRPTVALVILNWNNPEDTLACLRSVAKLDNPLLRVIVVDNGSTDDSVGRVRNEHPSIALIEIGANLGYAAGNNVGSRFALSYDVDYVCIINNDVIVTPDFLAPMVDAMAANDVGVITPLVALMAKPDTIWALGSAVDRKTGIVTRQHAGQEVAVLQPHPPFDVDIASGAAMLIKRAVLERVGYLDEAFYLYYEETDWCLQVRRAGYRILAVPASVVYHRVSATLGQESPITDYYMLRNHLRFISRHWSGSARWQLISQTVLRGLITVAAYTVKPRGGQRLPSRNARLLALRDAILGRWGKAGPDVEMVWSLTRR